MPDDMDLAELAEPSAAAAETGEEDEGECEDEGQRSGAGEGR